MSLLRPSRRMATAVGLAAAITLTTPALAMAGGHAVPDAQQAARTGLNNLSGATAVHSTHGIQPARADKKNAFPSSDSTVIASIGFIDAEQVGYFWSASRGDSVEQTFTGPKKVRKAILKLDVTDNGLSGAEVDWTVSINGTDVGSFVISEGESGPVTAKFKFGKAHITGGSYDVKMRVTNEVPSGDGAIALRYAGDGPHSLVLKKK